MFYFQIKYSELCFCVYIMTDVTSLVGGEVSEPDELILDSSSADMDFPLRLFSRGIQNQKGEFMWD